MKLGLDSYSYHLAFGAHPDFTPNRKMNLFQFIDRVKQLGLDGFQIDPMHLKSRDPGYLKEIRQYTRQQGLFLEYGTIGVASDDLVRELDRARQLGSGILRTFLGFNRYDRDVDIRFEITTAIQQLNKVKDVAGELGIKIAIENHGDVTTDELIEIVEHISHPNIGICFDLGNPLVTLEEPVQAAGKAAPYIFSTHFKDYAIQLTNYGFKVAGVALGDGNIDLEAALKILTEQTSLDRIILEIPVEAMQDQQAALAREHDLVQRSVIYARQVLKIV